MTAPVSLAPTTAVPATPGAGAPATPSDDVFASVLAALSGALGLPVPVPGQPQPPQGATGPDHAVPAAGAGTAAGVVAAAAAAGAVALPATAAAGAQQQPVPSVGKGDSPAAPAAWTAVTQRPALAGAPASQTPATAMPGQPQAADAPGHVAGTAPTHGTDVRAVTPAVDKPSRPEAAAPDVPAPQAVPVPDAPAVPPSTVAPAAPTAPTHADAPLAATTSTHHVKPALVEAARGLRHEGGGRTSLVVRLDPPELGAVLVRLTVQDGRVDVTLRTPDLAARADLQAQSYDVEQVLREQGFDLSSFDVGHGDVLPDGRGDAPDRGTPDRNRGADGPTAHSPVTDDGPAPEPSGTWL